MNIAITGPNGLVGSRIIELLKNDFLFLPIYHKDVDITNREQVFQKINELEFDMLLHLAAYTNVDKAEVEKKKAFDINVEGTKNLFDAVQEKGKRMIYFSTDFVFDGKNPPYNEDSQPNPLGYYAWTKREGEKIVEGKAMIVRISYPYDSVTDNVILSEAKNPVVSKPDFVQRIRALLEQGKQLTMIEDGSFTPTNIDDVAMALKYLMNNYSPETFHLVGSESLSPFAAGKLIAKKYNLGENLVQPTSFEEYSKGKAARPQWGEIKSKKNDFCEMREFNNF